MKTKKNCKKLGKIATFSRFYSVIVLETAIFTGGIRGPIGRLVGHSHIRAYVPAGIMHPQTGGLNLRFSAGLRIHISELNFVERAAGVPKRAF